MSKREEFQNPVESETNRQPWRPIRRPRRIHPGSPDLSLVDKWAKCGVRKAHSGPVAEQPHRSDQPAA